jgi:hypothetical protein
MNLLRKGVRCWRVSLRWLRVWNGLPTTSLDVLAPEWGPFDALLEPPNRQIRRPDCAGLGG